MKALIIAAVSLMIPMTAFAQRDGSGMGHSCHLAVARDDGKTLSDAETYEALVCFGYVSGFVDAVHLLNEVSTFKLVCFPEDRVPVVQAEKIFVKYLDAHPEELQKSAEFLLARSLQEAFPCKVPPPK